MTRFTAAVLSLILVHSALDEVSGFQPRTADGNATAFRVWTDKQSGKQVVAQFLNLDAKPQVAVFRGQNGKRYSCDLGRLSEVDIKYLANLQIDQPGRNGISNRPAYRLVSYLQDDADASPVEITLRGKVKSPGADPNALSGVIVRAKSETTLQTLDVDSTDATGTYKLAIPSQGSETVLLDFIPPSGFAPDTYKLLAGDLEQNINKVLKEGIVLGSRAASADGAARSDGAAESPVQKSEVQKGTETGDASGEDSTADGAVSAINLNFKESFDRLLTFEEIYARLLLTPNPDEYDQMLEKRITEFLEGMPRPRLPVYKGSGRPAYDTRMYDSLVSKFNEVNRLYGLSQPKPVTYRTTPTRRNCGILGRLFRRR